MPKPSRFHVVRTETTVAELTLAEAAEALMEEMRAAQPVAVLVGWETPDGAVHIRSVPESEALKRGLLLDMSRSLAPPLVE